MSLDQLAESLRQKFLDDFNRNPSRPCRVFLSATDMHIRAIVRHASNIDPGKAFDDALEQLSIALGAIEPTILRADWVINAEVVTWEQFLQTIGKIRRNFFRRGLALRPDFAIAFTELELNANLMLYLGGKEGSAYGVFRSDNSSSYCRRRFGSAFPVPEPSGEVILFDTAGVFVMEGEEPLSLDDSNISPEHRAVSHLDSDLILRLVRNGATHLARQVKEDGCFVYGLYPFFDRPAASYNSLRHFGAIFSMLDVLETCSATDDTTKLRKSISSAIDYGVQTFVQWRSLPDQTQAAYITEPTAGEVKLGAIGSALLALTKFTELMQNNRYIPLMSALARGICSMQNDDGSFTHVLNSEDYTVKDKFRTVFYDGEAVFGMMRLYAITKDERLIEASEHAFVRFIATDHWKNHDHWLSYAANELTKYRPQREYFEFGINNFLERLHFVYHRDTQFATLMELMMAADEMLERLKTMPEMSALLSKVNFDDFYAALEARAANMLNGYFYPELAMFFKRPESVVGSFFMRNEAFRVRIDDVEHFLSGLVAYRRYLAHRVKTPQPSAELLAKAPRPTAAAVKPVPKKQSVIVPTAPPPTSHVTQSHPISADPAFGESVLRVGVLRQFKKLFWHPQSTLYAMFYTAKQFNIELFLFGVDDINFENKTIDGMFLEGNTKVQRITSFPKIVDNKILIGEDAKKVSLLENDCYIIRHTLNTNKQKTYNMLLRDGRYADFLIRSHALDSREQMETLLEQYHNDVVVKPRNGGQGRDVVRITRDNGLYTINLKNQTEKLTPDEFTNFYNEHFVERKHILQPYIVSRTRQGNPFDIRVHARRGAGGKFKVSPFPRIGNADGVISNIAGGGFSMHYETFLKTEFGDDWQMIYDKIKDFGQKFPDYYQSLFPVTIFDIGVDMGIQRRGSDYDFKIFEVNTYIDGPFFEIEDAITHFEYYRYLDSILPKG